MSNRLWMFRYELTRRMIRYCVNHWLSHQGDRVPDGHWDSTFTVNDITLGNSPNYAVFQCLHMRESYYNFQKFLCDSSKDHLSSMLFLFLSAWTFCYSQIVQLTSKFSLCCSKFMSFLTHFPWPRIYFFFVSVSPKLTVLWGSSQVSS